MPLSIVCIIATEFCERFSFCGLRNYDLAIHEKHETELGNLDIISPSTSRNLDNADVVEEESSNAYLQRKRRSGSAVLVSGSPYKDELETKLQNSVECICYYIISSLMTVIGLTLISVGTGGSKPCLAAFGGDQFRLPQQRDQLQQFFSLFYFSINLGGFVGMIITPIMRKSVTCFGDDTCYALGFGFPALLILLSILIFIMGQHWYRMKSPKENIVLQFVKCTCYALYRSIRKGNHKEYWLDKARDKFDSKLVTDMKVVFAVLLLYTPLPLFWSLFDQQGSRWTFQASRMNDKFLGIQILPDQMQVVNPALVLIFIPFFDKIVYPYLGKMQFLENPLHRMAVGGLIAGFAFLSAGILELILQLNYPPLPGRHKAATNFINTLPCDIVIHSPFAPVLTLNSSGRFVFGDIVAHGSTIYNVTITTDSNVCGSILLTKKGYALKVLAVEYQTDTILIGVNKWNEISDYITDPVDYRVSLNERPRVRYVIRKN
ncbi:oligopeptide transporter-related [Holotrichia oblita]|uniref:Oligopeptide transporter-related n=1 Tax=Holotrichia oblita TaxID=644536 RepID=A0ACB9TZ97_HOLOL|nr:oligopeptide transporter-related [Holotrichia oblita]